MIKILKNDSGAELTILTREVPDQGQYEVSPHLYYELASDEDLLTLISSGDIIVNDGTIDLTIGAGQAHVEHGTILSRERLDLMPGLGAYAPEIVELSDSISGNRMGIGDILYGNKKFVDMVDEPVLFEIVCSCINTDVDKWIAWDVSFLATSGSDGSLSSGNDATITFGPFEVSTTSSEIVTYSQTIPTSYINSNKSVFFVGGKRVDVVPLSKTSPTNDIDLLGVFITYRKRLVK